MAGEHEEALAHERERVEAQEHAIKEIVVAADRFDFRQDAIGGEALIHRAGEDETLEGAEIDRVRGHAGVERARRLGRFAHGADVADGAVEEDAIDPLRVALRNADREILPVLVEETHRRVLAAGLIFFPG